MQKEIDEIEIESPFSLHQPIWWWRRTKMCHVVTHTQTHRRCFHFQIQSQVDFNSSFPLNIMIGPLFRLTFFANKKKKFNDKDREKQIVLSGWIDRFTFASHFIIQTHFSFFLFSLLFQIVDSGRYTLLSTGELLIRNATFQDSGFYRCQIRHQLTDELRTSDESGRLIVTGKFLFSFHY